ncbi:endolytic transglycosylase MltG [Chitinibacter fontanus]|uniref:Endolytic murein transglycosylase n=1 Tax=Chitinibacter fontanus TaxID=1737446 RepID=A0A7D5V846_9NEIS|nr:endolytic transglycosylase MltG [Chitinibacter fontanus]QLI80677.1 endolytic transglycosylase MltG [Chitinibacter fontanus]
MLGFAVLILAMGIGLGAAWFYSWSTEPQPKPAAGAVVLQPGSVQSLANQLKEQGAIDSAPLFTWLARVSGKDTQLKAGRYRITADISPWLLLRKLAKGDTDELMVTIVEGWNWRDVRKALNAHPQLKHDSAKLSDAEILAQLGITASSPEGLFFPETYQIEAGSSDLKLLARANRLLQKKLDETWAQRKEGLPLKDPYEVLILASLVEKETGRASDRPMVAGVFINRLKLGMRLQTDPAVIYGVGEAFTGDITKAHLKTDTPYNTYTRNGLTPTPIAMVGEAALRAAVQPADTSALYFVARGDGSSQFSNTLDEHNAAVRKYLSK